MSHICLFAIFFIFNIAVRFGDCKNNVIYGDDTDCAKRLPGSDGTRLSPLEKILFKLPTDTINDIIKRNNSKNNTLQGSFSNILEQVSSKGLILPGTLWCGAGNLTKNESDLGFFNKTDACCRQHDKCESYILAGDTKANLKNDGIFTRSACSCDSKQYECLKDADTIISNGIGNTYYNILQPQCFICVCPTDDCQPDVDTDCNNHCAKYKWVDNPKYPLI